MNDYVIASMIVLIILIILFIFTIVSYNVNNKTIPARVGPALSMFIGNIPAVIHRTYHTNVINQHMYQAAYQSWIDLNPNYTMTLSLLEDCEKELEKLDINYVKAWRRLIPIAYKADFWRACKLYEEGGIYVDAYAKPIISLNDIIELTKLKNEKQIFIAVQDLAGIHNGFMIATPKHPFLKQYIKNMINNIASGKEKELMTMTGPKCLQTSILEVLNNKTYQFKLGINDMNNYKFYLFHWNIDLHQTIDDHGVIIMQKKYDICHCILNNYIYKFLTGSPGNYAYSYFSGKVCHDN